MDLRTAGFDLLSDKYRYAVNTIHACLTGSCSLTPKTTKKASCSSHTAYTDRNLVESHFATIKGNYNNLDRPLNIRTSGTEARGIATLCIFAAMNIRLIARHRTKRGQQPHPASESPDNRPDTLTGDQNTDTALPRPEPPDNTPAA